MHSDPVADMLTRIRNGYRARHQQVGVPFSRLKEQIAIIFKREGYITQFAIDKAQGVQGAILLDLKYDENRVAVMAGVQRLSSPGRRRSFSCDKIPHVRSGLGIIILTTSRGLMTDSEARKARVGGEALCAVW